MEFVKNVVLKKIHTREDARHPQKEKYPDGKFVVKGYIDSMPKEGRSLRINYDSYDKVFYTSTIQDINQINENEYELITLNSIYKLILTD
jgi:hypothetical protein